MVNIIENVKFVLSIILTLIGSAFILGACLWNHITYIIYYFTFSNNLFYRWLVKYCMFPIICWMVFCLLCSYDVIFIGRNQ